MEFTPRYGRGTPEVGAPLEIADPSIQYIGSQTIFTPSDSDVEEPRLLTIERELSFEIGEATSLILPRGSHISIYCIVVPVGTTDLYDASFEVSLVPVFGGGIIPLTAAESPIAVAWVWGGGSVQPAFPFGGWVMSVGGIRGPFGIRVRSGIYASSDPSASAQISLGIYLHNENCAIRDRISPICTVPPFDLNGGYLFSRNATNNKPLQQTAQCQRQFFAQGEFEALGNAESRKVNIFGGPWVGQMLYSADTTAITANSKAMDADPVNGFVVDTANTQRDQVVIADPSRYNWNQFEVTNGATPQDVSASFGLTSPTR